MRKKMGALTRVASNYQRKATTTATKMVYQVLFNEKPNLGGKKKKSQ